MVNKFLYKGIHLHRSSSDTCINTVTTLEEMEFIIDISFNWFEERREQDKDGACKAHYPAR